MPKLTHAAELTESYLLLVGDLDAQDASAPKVELLSPQGAIPLNSRCLPASSVNGAAGSEGLHQVLIALLPQTSLERERDARLTIEIGDRTVDVPARDLQSVVADLGTLVRRSIAPLDADSRAKALEFIASTLKVVSPAEREALSESLFELREALRERLPLSVVAEDGQHDLRVDRIMAVSDHSFYVDGMLRDAGLVRLTAVAPEGSRCELRERLFTKSTSGIEDPAAFVCFFELDAPSLRDDGWLIELETTRGIATEVELPSVIRDGRDAKDAILRNPEIAAVPDDELMSRHVVPAISRIQERLGKDARVDSVVQFGERPRSAVVSIVVPLYLRLQHLEVQLAQFADDPDLHEADLLYVLDSPEQREELLGYAADLFPIYQVPFRVAVLERNAGYAGANNAGAGMADSRLLLLLNSDVLPDRPGWLRTMCDFYDRNPKIGALGPKLLYEDNSIQHAGMYFHRLPGSSKWVDGHYFKGMHRSLPAACVARSVPLVSGSCLMIDRALYERVGGLSTAYVQGDYEDADLCLKLIQQGRENWYLPAVELFHLEGQSYSGELRHAANRYNMWLHNQMWRDQIVELMKDQDQPSPHAGNVSAW